jgi:Glyoxalase/Bleomycin resistance protein/Dioxygenase superfamily
MGAIKKERRLGRPLVCPLEARKPTGSSAMRHASAFRKGRPDCALQIVRYGVAASPSFARKDVDMESIISNLLTRFEKGSLSRRELVRGLAMLAASGTAAAAQEEIDFKSADIDHVSIQVADLQRSVDFYQKMFGFSVISQDQPHGIIRLGNTRTLVSTMKALQELWITSRSEYPVSPRTPPQTI